MPSEYSGVFAGHRQGVRNRTADAKNSERTIKATADISRMVLSIRQGTTQAAGNLASEAKQAIKVGQPYVHVDDRGVARVFHPIHTGSSETPWSLMVTFDTAAALTA